MRPLRSALFFSVLSATPALAQSSEGAWELGVGPHVVYRESSSSTHFGGGVTVARRFERFAVVVEGSGTRRQGHNDWRALAGPRLIAHEGSRTSFFVQALAGTLIRSSDADWAVAPGLGFDVSLAGARAVRFQLDAPIERAEGRTSTSVRGSVWFVF